MWDKDAAFTFQPVQAEVFGGASWQTINSNYSLKFAVQIEKSSNFMPWSVSW